MIVEEWLLGAVSGVAICDRAVRACCACLRECCSDARYPYLNPGDLEAVLLGLPVVVWGGRSMEEGAGGAVSGDRFFSGI